MLGTPDEKTVENLRKQYPKGTRIELISMDDPYSDLAPGDRGSVILIDDSGTAHIRWDTGSGLGLVYGEDSYRKLTEQEFAAESELGYENEEDELEI